MGSQQDCQPAPTSCKSGGGGEEGVGGIEGEAKDERMSEGKAKQE